jgi:hypothetical protein
MKDLYHKNLAPIEVHSDGRRYKRFTREESVTITFRGKRATGNLVNLSPSGLFATFPKVLQLPSVSEEVSVHIELDGKDNVLDINGPVVRIQPPGEYESNDVYGVAIDFGGLDLAAQNRIKKIIEYLLVRDSNYNA